MYINGKSQNSETGAREHATIELGLVLCILEKEITNVISTQMSKKAPGPDQISNKMLKITWSVTASF